MLWVRIPLGVLLDILVIVPTVARDFLLWGFLLESKPGSWCGWRLSRRLGPLSGAGDHRVRWHRVVRDPLPWSLASGLLLMSARFAVKVADVGMVCGQGRRCRHGLRSRSPMSAWIAVKVAEVNVGRCCWGGLSATHADNGDLATRVFCQVLVCLVADVRQPATTPLGRSRQGRSELYRPPTEGRDPRARSVALVNPCLQTTTGSDTGKPCWTGVCQAS